MVVFNPIQTIFVEWRASVSLKFVEKKQCIYFVKVVVLKTDENNFVESASISLMFFEMIQCIIKKQFRQVVVSYPMPTILLCGERLYVSHVH